jgi:hypothetical protein
MTRISVTLHEEPSTCVITFIRILPRMSNISEDYNQNQKNILRSVNYFWKSMSMT